MRLPSTLLTLSFLVLGVVAHAIPPAGKYLGILKTRKTIDGLAVTTSVRAEARVSADGRLSIINIIPESPLPQTQGADTQAGETALASNVLRTTIAADNTCIIPGSRIRPTLPLGTVLEEPPIFYGPTVVPSPFSGHYTHLGQIRIDRNRFHLSYTDVARERNDINPLPVPPPSLTEFTYTFRRTGN